MHMRERIKRVVQHLGGGRLLAVERRVAGAFRLLRPSPYPLHRDEAVAPFFIVGSGRNGGTLLKRILQASPEVHIPPENWQLARAIHRFERYGGCLSWRELVCLVVGTLEHQENRENGHRWFREPPTRLVQFLAKDVPEPERSLARLIDEIYRYHGRALEATFQRWGDKTPLLVNHMHEIRTVFPDARFVHMLRDGVDVAYACFTSPGKYDNIFEPAARWKRAVHQMGAFADKHPDQCMQVRYEDLVSRPEETVCTICDFLYIEFDESMLTRTGHQDQMPEIALSRYDGVFEKITTEYIGEGRRNISDEDKEHLASLIGDTVVSVGYESI